MTDQQRGKMAAKADRLNKAGVCCYLCSGPFGHERYDWPTRDHVVPLSDPEFATKWRHKRENIKWAHFLCNQNKANMPVTYYRMMAMFAGTDGGQKQWLDLRMSNPNLSRSLEEFR